MLSTEEIKAIDAERAHYPTAQAVGIEAMKIVQHHRGWVSDESLREIAEYLGLSVESLDGAATFYNLIFRRPVGKHVILICDSVSCWIMGYEQLREQLQTELKIGLGETTQDGRFTLLPSCCLGACERAPVMVVDQDLHGDLDSEKIGEILAGYE
ncbi:NADH dehydrogenase subunit E [Nitrosococcus oceani ATCC 19707]|uniref:NADH-quinone oxidoreductase subunit E n=2 Tax=Nitrosococcus oceani TaxID=1229 RepID=Q3JC18_NITOC|nr:NADH-quinone oxidoreductase subunit NuoE [Nitrosococcus oceani]ABA57628.1 NADH dehydrogenase subunit E [Nitrosococcus oceani ATCC 19707]EDZ66880.1 NADH-quinone oxidoreductase, E subunit subfamily [Nitrosococcus oceani AFC27]KFI19912.1 NADH dehydrogenase [Nitrosococcus oceani C-27]GEM19267.1 NADH-quinone oxidoreductase subunit E [Nitrosococcus oceani]